MNYLYLLSCEIWKDHAVLEVKSQLETNLGRNT